MRGGVPTGIGAMGPFRPRADVIETDLGDESILLDPQTQQMYSLRGSGRAIWKALPAPDLAAVVGAIRDAFDVSPERASGDVNALMTELVDAGLVQAGGGAGADG